MNDENKKPIFELEVEEDGPPGKAFITITVRRAINFAKAGDFFKIISELFDEDEDEDEDEDGKEKPQ